MTEENTGKITTIKLSRRTKERMDKLRVHKRETYEEIVESMLNILNILKINPEMARKKLVFYDRQIRKRKKREIANE
ncbi:MAG: hypothetical protein AABY10_06345 [Nanoarchaeota archaeon]